MGKPWRWAQQTHIFPRTVEGAEVQSIRPMVSQAVSDPVALEPRSADPVFSISPCCLQKEVGPIDRKSVV